MIRKIKKRITSALKRTKPAAKAKKTVPPKTARVVGKAASPHSERAKARGTTPAIESGTKRAAARKRKRATKASSSSESDLELRRAQSARRKLERQLTAAVQEIGLLRQYQTRAEMLERELERRNQELSDLRRQQERRIREPDGRAAEAEALQGRLI